MKLGLALLLILASIAVRGAAAEPIAEPLLAVSTAGRIVVVEANGSHRRVLTDRVDGRAVEPAWSPDAKRIAYVRLRRRAAAVFVVPAAGGEPHRLTRNFRAAQESEPWVGQPVWSPDSRSVAFVAAGTVYVADTNGPLRRIAKAPSEGDGRPQWLANGLLSLCRGYSDNAMLVDPATGRATEIGRANCAERGPFWSPDGSRYLLALRDGRWNGQLFVLDRNGARSRLTNDVPLDGEVHFDACCARWSEDGSRIVFLSDRIGGYHRDAFLIRNDGSHERRLTWHGGISDAALSGDGSTVGVLRASTLWAISLAGGPKRRISDHVNWGWAWAPQPREPVRQPPVKTIPHAARRVAVRQTYYGFRPHRLVAVRPFAASVPGELEQISRNGRFATFAGWGPNHRYSVGVVDLARARIRTLAFGLTAFDPSAPLSPEGDAILVRRWTRLYRVDVSSGRTRYLTSGAAGEPAGWLSHSRVRFVDRRGRLVDVRPGDRARPTGLVLPRAMRRYATWSASGRYVLYARDCATWLRDLRSGHERRIAGPAIPGAWSPDGLHFTTTAADWEDHCTNPWTALWGGFSVWDVHGRGIGGSFGGYPAWSADGRMLTVNGGVSGTAVAYLQPLSVFRLRSRTFVPLLANRLDGTALAGPGGWLLYGRFPAGANPEGPEVRSSLYVARLASRWR